jgi:hypothetical protein
MMSGPLPGICELDMQLPMAIQKTLRAVRLTLLSTGVLMLAGWGTVFADIAPFPLSGGTNLANKGEKTSVAMVDEVVKLRVSREACHVDVVFTMTNKGKVAETIPVGFPFFYADELKDFKAAIDDKKISATDERGGRLSGGSIDEPAGWKPYWKLWKTTFQPGKPVKIAVSYWTNLSSESWSWNVEQQRIPALLATLVPEKERAALEKQLDVRRVTYILRTGSRWSGPIGRCRIEAAFDGISTDNLTMYGPNFEIDRATITADKITWDLKDYEPNRDVELRISPFISRKATLQLLERLQKQNLQSPLLTAVLVEYLNAAGRQPEAEATLLQFLNHCQDKVVIWGPRDKQGLSLEESVSVFNMVQQVVGTPRFPKGESHADLKRMEGLLPTFQPRDPGALVPAIKRIALSVKEQWKQVPKANPNYANEAETILTWCQKHAN